VLRQWLVVLRATGLGRLDNPNQLAHRPGELYVLLFQFLDWVQKRSGGQKYVESRMREAAAAIEFYDMEQTMIRSELMNGLIVNGGEQVLPRDRGRQHNLRA
jgi:hypothetical protein